MRASLMMEKLVKGIHSFQKHFFTKHQELFEQLASRGQNPETLFVTCSDSRVDPNLITNSRPGDLFIVRNVGNVIPRPDLPGGTAAAVEYAVEVLGVKDIIVCGHTQCGAMASILQPEKMASLQYVKRWLAQTEGVRNIIQTRYGHLPGDAKVTAAVAENVLMQLEHLRAYPFVAEKLDAGKLHIAGWIFEIGTGAIHGFDPDTGEFTAISSADGAAAETMHRQE
ncbi:carbonic anhydrase [Pendulispora rubella]|uniref:Carbonic anhydrase n=1 Tax=Pendulispora rubella TaxID=2741070 RepID=A0ABZ2L4F8_9BACT